MVSNKKVKKKKHSITKYRTKEERHKEVKLLIKKLDELKLSRKYEAVQIFYKILFEYIDVGNRIIIDIPFPEINKRIEGVLSTKLDEEVAIRLKALP